MRRAAIRPADAPNIEAARQAVADVPGIQNVFTTLGGAQEGVSSRPQAGEGGEGSLILTLKPRDQRAHQKAIETLVRQRLLQIPGARFTVGSGGLGEKMQLILASDDAEMITGQTILCDGGGYLI